MRKRDLRSSLLMELRRGTLVLSVLSQMGEPKYGYSPCPESGRERD